ncbi:MAG: right-handed parallel beta-helix repeat-containing protein [Caldilineaceae bacterium]
MRHSASPKAGKFQLYTAGQRRSYRAIGLLLLGLQLIYWVWPLALPQTSWPVKAVQAAGATVEIVQDSNKQPTIQVTGAGASVTLADIQSALPSDHTSDLVNQGNRVWRLNANLLIGAGVTLTLSPATGVRELQLRSEGNAVLAAANVVDPWTPASESADPDVASVVDKIDYKTFVYLRTDFGAIHMDGVKIYSWDAAANQVDNDYNNGRAYILAKYASVLTIRNSDIGHLGSKDGESYGLSWRDQNDSAAPDLLLTRVTGELINSAVHHNYYGVYTYQATNMTFRGNKFYANIRYGFDPHDYSHHFTVEDNEAYDNGAHGFIISRGCNNFTFRNNVSYNNFDTTSNQAHGFMLDPGGADINKPQSPSHDNVLDNNTAYDNEGHGLRVLGSTNNQILNNNFYNNDSGINLDDKSTDNEVRGNRFNNNSRYGVWLRDGGDSNQVVNNEISGNGRQGIYVLSSSNALDDNTVAANQMDGITLESGASHNSLSNNTIRSNTGFGISASGSKTTYNTWSKNLIYGNLAGGIKLSGSANQNLAAPTIASAGVNQVTGAAKAGQTVQIFADAAGQGQYFEGESVVGSDGSFHLTITGNWRAANLTALAIDSSGNASPFSVPVAVAGASVTTPTRTATATPSATATPTVPATATPTATPTSSPQAPTTMPTSTPTGTVTPPTITSTPSVTPTTLATITPSVTATATEEVVGVSTSTPTPTGTPTAPPTATPSVTPVLGESIHQLYLPMVNQ